MTRDEARKWAMHMVEGLPYNYGVRLKAVHVQPKLHQGMLTVRLHFYPMTADDPEPYVFRWDELAV